MRVVIGVKGAAVEDECCYCWCDGVGRCCGNAHARDVYCRMNVRCHLE